MKPSHRIQVHDVPGLYINAYPMGVLFAFALTYGRWTHWVLPGLA